jgi:hypothetical protein
MNSTPGLRSPTEFEFALLRQFAAEHPQLRIAFESLHVISRDFTGVGSFTTFLDGISTIGPSVSPLSISREIIMPGVPSGMTCLLFCRPGESPVLEVATYGDEHWSGDAAGFDLSAAS